MRQPRIARSVVKVPPRVREGMSRKHLDDVKKLPCVVCGKPADDPHHLMRGTPAGSRGTSLTAPDRYAIPLCRPHHRDGAHGKHGDDEAWLASQGVDGRAVADALWRERGDEDAMRRVVERSLLGRRRYEEVAG